MQHSNRDLNLRFFLKETYDAFSDVMWHHIAPHLHNPNPAASLAHTWTKPGEKRAEVCRASQSEQTEPDQ